jgi:hypothetical protein
MLAVFSKTAARDVPPHIKRATVLGTGPFRHTAYLKINQGGQVWCACLQSQLFGDVGRRIMVQGWPQAKKHETYLKK